MPALLRRLAIALLTGRRTRGRWVLLAWRALTVTLLRRLLSISTLLLLRAAILAARRTTRRTAVASSTALLAALLVLSVIAWVNGSEDELENPKVRGELDWGLSASHFCRFIFVVRSTVDH